MVEVVYIHGWGWFELYHWLDLSMIVWLLILVCGMIYLPLFRAPPCSWWCNCLWREGTPPPCSPILSTAVHPLHGRSLFRDSVSYNVTTPGNYKITHLCMIYIYKTVNVACSCHCHHRIYYIINHAFWQMEFDHWVGWIKILIHIREADDTFPH